MGLFHHHDHSHSTHGHHDHQHSHENHAGRYSRAFAFGIGANLFYVVLEVAFGIYSNSLALIADAGHNFSDVISLVIAWIAIKLSSRKPSQKYTYGLKRTSILASLINAVLLLISVGVILVEAIKKLISPSPVESGIVMWVAGVGILVNACTAMLFMKDREDDLNIKSAFQHLAADALISLGVVLTGVVIYFTGMNWLDPVMSMFIVLVIVAGTWSILSESVNLAVDAVPAKISHQKVKNYLESQSGVVEVHDLHIWGMSTTDVALTAHIVVDKEPRDNLLLGQICEDLKVQHGIGHSTIQVEYREGKFVCELKSDEVV